MARVRFKVTDDHTQFDKIEKELEKLMELQVVIMIDPTEVYPEGPKVEKVAMWMEYGWDEFEVNYPSRPFWRSAFAVNEKRIIKKLEDGIGDITAGTSTAREVFEEIGKYAVKKVKQMILKGSYEPLRPFTIQKKGSSKPLIDTKKLLNSVIYKVQLRRR